MRYIDLEKTLQEDIGWRKKELSSLFDIAFSKKNEAGDDDVLYKTIIRTLYLLLYSHWEGFIKKSSKIYLSYINQKRIRTSDLTSTFSALILKKSINDCYSKESQESLSIDTYLDFVKLHSTKLSANFKVSVKVDNDFDDGFIKTFSNLNYKNYKNLTNSLDLPFPDYFSNPIYFVEVIDVNETKQKIEILKKHIDFDLLLYRHSIAHGGTPSLELDLDVYELLQEKILYIMDMHYSNILNYCYDELFKSSNSEKKQTYNKLLDQKVLSFFENLEKSTQEPHEDFLADHN